MNGYPKVKYPKQGGGSILVLDIEQDKRLGDGWTETKPILYEMEIKKLDGWADTVDFKDDEVVTYEEKKDVVTRAHHRVTRPKISAI